MWFLLAQILMILVWITAWPTMPLWLVFLPFILGAIILACVGIFMLLTLAAVLIGSFSK